MGVYIAYLDACVGTCLYADCCQIFAIMDNIYLRYVIILGHHEILTRLAIKAKLT